MLLLLRGQPGFGLRAQLLLGEHLVLFSVVLTLRGKGLPRRRELRYREMHRGGAKGHRRSGARKDAQLGVAFHPILIVELFTHLLSAFAGRSSIEKVEHLRSFLLHRAQEDKHGVFRALRGAQVVPHLLQAAPHLHKQRLDRAADLRDLLLAFQCLLLVVLADPLRVGQLVLEVVQGLHTGPVQATSLVLVQVGAQCSDALREQLDLLVEVVDKVVHAKVLLLRVDKLLHKELDIIDLCGFHQLTHGLFRGGLRHGGLLQGVLLGLGRAPGLLLGALLLIRRAFLRQPSRLHPLALPQTLLECLISLQHAVQLAEVLLILHHVLLCRELQRIELMGSHVTLLIVKVGLLDDVCHLLLLLVELALELFVDPVKDHALPSEVVNLLAELLVLRQGLVELHQGLVQAVLQHSDLLAHHAVLLAADVHSAHHPPSGVDLLAGVRNLLIQTSDLRSFRGQLAVQALELLRQRPDGVGVVDVVCQGVVLRGVRQLGLQGVVLLGQRG
eukprot:RCo019866